MTSDRARRVPVVDGLRGLASLSVCWYHFVYADGAFAGGGIVAAALRDSARNAWTGVEVFFVISGFVIPLALFRSGYTPRSYGSFLMKRVVRLDPPYLVSVALAAGLWFLWAAVPRLHGPPFTLTPLALLLHLGYLNAFFHQGWLNPVYWTLAIEFQYYLGMGLIFPLLIHRLAWVRLAAFGGLALLGLALPAPSLVFHYLFVFMLGIATFQYVAGLLPFRGYLILLAALTLGCQVTLGPMVAGIALVTAVIIVWVRRDIPVLGALGTISYSLYLIHVPVGGRILGLALAHVHGGTARVAVLFLTLSVTIAFAALFYWLIERPARRWSSSLSYGSLAHGLSRLRRPVVTGIAEP